MHQNFFDRGLVKGKVYAIDGSGLGEDMGVGLLSPLWTIGVFVQVTSRKRAKKLMLSWRWLMKFVKSLVSNPSNGCSWMPSILMGRYWLA